MQYLPLSRIVLVLANEMTSSNSLSLSSSLVSREKRQISGCAVEVEMQLNEIEVEVNVKQHKNERTKSAQS